LLWLARLSTVQQHHTVVLLDGAQPMTNSHSVRTSGAGQARAAFIRRLLMKITHALPSRGLLETVRHVGGVLAQASANGLRGQESSMLRCERERLDASKAALSRWRKSSYEVGAPGELPVDLAREHSQRARRKKSDLSSLLEFLGNLLDLLNSFTW
jgi:hypothetical protein